MTGTSPAITRPRAGLPVAVWPVLAGWRPGADGRPPRNWPASARHDRPGGRRFLHRVQLRRQRPARGHSLVLHPVGPRRAGHHHSRGVERRSHRPAQLRTGDEATPRLMPLTVSVALLKGGVSKTTTAIALGEAAALSV